MQGVGQIKEERFRGGEENGKSKEKDQDVRICCIFLLCSTTRNILQLLYSLPLLPGIGEQGKV